MTFVTVLALAVAALVAAPWFAHRLRRQRAEEHPFAPARLATAFEESIADETKPASQPSTWDSAASRDRPYRT